jgi:hypothetical protein
MSTNLKRFHRRGLLLIGAALLFFALRAQAQAPKEAPKQWPVRVEVKAPLSGRSIETVTNAALRQGKDDAIKEFIAASVPPGLLKGRQSSVKSVLADRDRYVASWEVVSSQVNGDQLDLVLAVNLNWRELTSALRREGLLPARSMPRTFIVAAGRAGTPLRSGWDRAKGEPGQWNRCEAVIAAAFEQYGFEVVKPGIDQAPVSVARIVAPEGPEEKAAVFRDLRDHFQAAILVVGLVSGATPKSAKPGETDLTVRIAACDAREESVILTRQASGRHSVKTDADRDNALDALCRDAAQQVVEKLFSELNTSFTPGAEHTLTVIVRGVDSYPRMKELERKLKTESPGAQTAVLARIRPGEIEYTVTTTADAKTLARWLETNSFDGLFLKAQAIDDARIEATAPTAPAPEKPAQDKPKTQPGDTAGELPPH